MNTDFNQEVRRSSGRLLNSTLLRLVHVFSTQHFDHIVQKVHFLYGMVDAQRDNSTGLLTLSIYQLQYPTNEAVMIDEYANSTLV
jgi:hypothetical protein